MNRMSGENRRSIRAVLMAEWPGEIHYCGERYISAGQIRRACERMIGRWREREARLEGTHDIPAMAQAAAMQRAAHQLLLELAGEE